MPFNEATYGGLLTNATGSNGVNGGQAGDLSAAANSGLLFQEVGNNYASTDPVQTFQAGYTYTLTIGCGLRNGSVPAIGVQLTLQMFSRPRIQGAATILASTPLTVGVTPGFLTTPGVLTDYTVTYTVPAGSASIGKPVGILFNVSTPTTVTSGGDFVFDNVRLTSVLEPSTYVLFGADAAGLAGFSLLRCRQQA